jgi:hypothetical protein
VSQRAVRPIPRMPVAPNIRAVYERWMAAAGPWAGFVRAVPLVALARGAIPVPVAAPPAPVELSATLVRVGTQEGWLRRPDVLLLLDLPGALGVGIVAGLVQWGVRPVLLLFQWPAPGAVVPTDDLLAALLRDAPELKTSEAEERRAAQYAFVLARERTGPGGAVDLTRQFDNRYELGAIDLPSAARLAAGNITAVVACRLASTPPAADLGLYLNELEITGVPLRRLALGQ